MKLYIKTGIISRPQPSRIRFLAATHNLGYHTIHHVLVAATVTLLTP